jgi:hypothetical protein
VVRFSEEEAAINESARYPLTSRLLAFGAYMNMTGTLPIGHGRFCNRRPNEIWLQLFGNHDDDNDNDEIREKPTCYSFGSFQVEADVNGDGVYNWDSGDFSWSDL